MDSHGAAARFAGIVVFCVMLLAGGYLVVLNAPTTVAFGRATYEVPKRVQFAAGLRSPGEVSLMLRGQDLAAHVAGYHATLRTYTGDQGPDDTPVGISPRERFDDVLARRGQTAGVQVASSIERRVLVGQEEVSPSCYDSQYQDARPYKTCLFTFRDSGVTLSFWLSDANLPFAPFVARYAVEVLERYRKG